MAKVFKNNLLFDYLGNILKNKSKNLYEKHISDDQFVSSFQSFMVIKYLSMHTSQIVRNVVLANQKSLEQLPPAILYKFLLFNIPQQQSAFIKYIK